MQIRNFIALVMVFFVCDYLHAQQAKKFTSQNFSVNEGLLVNKITDLAEDNNGFIWISSGDGLQRFDGSNFETIPIQIGLPETNHPCFFKLGNGNIWLSYYTGISVYDIATNKFRIIFKNADTILKKLAPVGLYEISPLMPVIEGDHMVWCWSSFQQEFVGFDKYNYRICDKFKLPDSLSSVRKFKITLNGTLCFYTNRGITEIEFNSKKVKHIYPFLQKMIFYDFWPLKNNHLLLISEKGILSEDINGNVRLLSRYPSLVDAKNIMSTSLELLYDNLYVLGLNNQLYVINAETGEFLYRMVNQKYEPFSTPGYINFCKMDHSHHLWVVSYAEGLKKINFNNLEVKYYGTTDVQKNFTRCIYPDKKVNRIITGSLFNGVSVFDTSGTLLKQFNLSPYVASQEVNIIIKIAEYKYLIFFDSKHSAYLLDAKSLTLSLLSKNIIPSGISLLETTGDSTALILNGYGLVKVHYSQTNLRSEKINFNKFFLAGFLDNSKRLWTGTFGKYSIFTGKNYESEKIFNLNENVDTKCFYQDKVGFVWLGTEGGLYKLNSATGSVLHIYKKTDGLADETIYSILGDEHNNIWFSTNKGISCIYNSGKIINLYASDGLQANEFNTNTGAKADDGELFFGGINGVNSFYPDKINSIVKEPKIVMSKLKVMDEDWRGDSASWNVSQLTLPYTQNVISFSFIAIGWYNPEVYNYQYKMAGLDKEWVNAGNHGYARYVLPPGKYTFEYSAGSRFEKDIKFKKYISIIITPPFWQTAWFRSVMIIFSIFLLIGFVRIYDKQKYKKQFRIIEIQQTVQHERERISRDLHDNIGAYTTVLIASAEQLSKKVTATDTQQSAQTVSENAKNILGSLQETIWVLSNNTITITDFADRFKVYAKKMIYNFPGVQIKFAEKLDKNSALSPSEALNIFRIMQEALQNTLKHSKADHIKVSVISNEKLFISIKDNGNGFDELKANTGNGLYNMRHRAKESGYEINIIANEMGTEVSLEKNNSFAV